VHEEHFRQVYAVTFEPLPAYALRRVEQPADAADIVAARSSRIGGAKRCTCLYRSLVTLGDHET